MTSLDPGQPSLPPDPRPGGRARFHALVATSRERAASERARTERLLKKHRHRPLVDVAIRVYERDRESAGTLVGSAIAFRLFLFFVPLLLFVVGLAGFITRRMDPNEVNDVVGVTGTVAAQINTALTQPNSTRWLAVGTGLIGMVTTGRSLSKVLIAASCLAWRLPMQAKASLRVVGAVVGLVVGIALISVTVNRVRADLGLTVTSLSFLAAFGLYVLAWMVLHGMLPRGTGDPGALLPGAVVLAATLAAMQAVSQLYLPDKFASASALYGAIGITVVTLGWFFILGRVVVFAVALDAVIYERFGSISRVVFSLPVLRILPRRSSWVRRLFDLDG